MIIIKELLPLALPIFSLLGTYIIQLYSLVFQLYPCTRSSYIAHLLIFDSINYDYFTITHTSLLALLQPRYRRIIKLIIIIYSTDIQYNLFFFCRQCNDYLFSLLLLCYIILYNVYILLLLNDIILLLIMRIMIIILFQRNLGSMHADVMII